MVAAIAIPSTSTDIMSNSGIANGAVTVPIISTAWVPASTGIANVLKVVVELISLNLDSFPPQVS